ncbi:MAG: hypothetical protein WBA97_17480 [Actinophytocola sp.]|uniref:hypothetical protein n=1 Tax=Actinophytocola sp. TaxID=1872138 RepID=UPI003C78DF49
MDVSADDVRLDQHSPGWMRFSFHCPSCLDVVAKGCDTQVGRLLLLNGAHADHSSVAALDTFGHEHITRLRALLDEPDWFDQLRAAG